MTITIYKGQVRISITDNNEVNIIVPEEVEVFKND